MWLECIGVVSRCCHIDFLFIPTPLVLVFFCSSIPAPLFIFKFFLRRRIRKKKNAKSRFFTSRGAGVNCAIIALLYTH